MHTDHAHVEAAVAASFFTGLVAIVDIFVNVADGNPAKLPVYAGIFVAVYVVARVFLRRAWK